MNEAVVIPIVIDPKAGVAGLAEIGDQAQKTNAQMGGATTGVSKFGDSMKGIARNALQMIGVMSMADEVVKLMVGGLLDAINGTNKLASSTKMLDDIQRKAVESTRDEVVQLQLLYDVARDTTLSYAQRQAAIDEMNRKYPELHKNITLENVLTQQTADAIDAVLQKMVQKVQLQGIINQIAELQNQYDRLKEFSGEIGDTFLIGDGVLNRMDQLNQRIQDLYKTARGLQGNNKVDFGGLLGGAAGETGEAKEVTLESSKLKIKPKELEVDYKWNLMDVERMFPGLSGGLAQYLAQQEAQAAASRKYDLSTDKAKSEGKGYDEQIRKGNEEWDKFISKQEYVADQVTGLLTPAFDSMFDAIFSKEDPLKAFFNAIGQSVKRLISQLMAAAIQAGVLSLLTGGAAKGGISFGKAFGQMLGFAQGGLVTGPVSALVGEGMGTNPSNPEVVAPLDKLKSFFSNMLVDGRFNTGNMGTSGALISMPQRVELFASGRNLYGAITLEQLSQGRTG